MTWIDTAAELRDARVPAVLVTLASVRGHAPREAGAKLIVTAEELHGTIGGGNLEMTAVTRARELLAEGNTEPEVLTLRLNDKAPAKYGRQCYGWELTVFFEPLPLPISVEVFRIGNFGLDLARELGRQEIELQLTASRPDDVTELDHLEPPVARIKRNCAVAGEQVVNALPAG